MALSISSDRMMEESLSRGESPSVDSNLSGRGELNPSLVSSMEERLVDITGKQSFGNVRTPPTKKAKRVRFFRNGDKFYTGVVMAVTPERYRSFDSLATDLTRALVSSVTLPSGVRSIYAMDGKKVQSITDLEDGKCYVVSGQGEIFKKVEYSSSKVRRGSSLSGLPQSPAGTGRQVIIIPACVKARIITLIRHGTKPRKVFRLLLNKRNAASLDHALEAITEIVKLDCGAVRRVYTLSGKLVIALEQFFESEEVFLAYGSEKSTQEDYELDVEESKSVQSYRRGPWVSKRQSGPMPVMPRKTGKRIGGTAIPQVRTPSPTALMLPQPLRLQYSVGHVIGDGNFAVVRHCVHKTTGAEYAMKIIDKYKCQGKETMLTSEVAILRQVCHPNIISLIGEQETTDQLFLVMELVKGGDLFDAIAAVTKFSEPEASVMIGHLTSALAYLHSHQIVHRDVKPENLLVEMEGSHVKCLKLGDFGLAQIVLEPLYTVCGTPTYVAPEILAETGYGLKIDVWAAGVILYILLCGFPPFVSPENDQEELFERILSSQYEFTQPYWDPISDSAKQLISNMLQSLPELRFSAEDVLDHPWLVSFLGDEKPPGGFSTVEPSQQYGYQQRQPMRLATFEFNYKKQRCSSSGDVKDEAGCSISSDEAGSRWIDVAFVSETSKNTGATETDQFNGNCIAEPISLSSDCLQDIHAVTTSLQNLMNINDEAARNNSSTQDATSINSISENYHSMTSNNNGLCQSPTSSKLHSANKRNGNSLSDIHSSVVPTPPQSRDDNYRFVTPKSVRHANKPRTQRKILYNANNTNSTDQSLNEKNLVGARNSPIDRLSSQSTDCLSGSSDNNIETSDSFINIQFANVMRDPCSSSNPSIDSSESFENIRFDTGNTFTMPANPLRNNDSTRNQNAPRNSKGVNRNSRLFESNIPKLSRVSLIPVVNGQRQSARVNERLEKPQNESVKLREKKNLGNTGAQTKNMTKAWESRNKRFSYVPQYSARRTQDSETGTTNHDVVVNGRKCSSTDELREDSQLKPSAKSHRHSLYYTPQLTRKTYDSQDGVSKSSSRNYRPTSWKTLDSTTISDDRADSSERRLRHRRSVVDSTTVASRYKNNRQSIHGKVNVAHATLPTGRTK